MAKWEPKPVKLSTLKSVGIGALAASSVFGVVHYANDQGHKALKTITQTQTCQEGEPCWDCHTMGNHLCGTYFNNVPPQSIDLNAPSVTSTTATDVSTKAAPVEIPERDPGLGQRIQNYVGESYEVIFDPRTGFYSIEPK